MSKRNPLAQPRNPLLSKVCSYLVKIYSASLLGLTVVTLVLGLFGWYGVVGVLLAFLLPWLIRSAVLISCVLLVNSFSEAI